MVYSLRSIAKGSLLYTAGQVLTKASAFLLIPLYTRFLTPDDYGIVGYMQFVSQILATILMFGFYASQARFFYQHKNDPTVIGEYLFSINAWLMAALLCGILAVSVFGETLYASMGPDDIPFRPYVPVIAWTVFFQVMNQMVISYGMVRKQYARTTLLQFTQFVILTVFTIAWVVFLKMGAEGKIKALLYGQMVFFLIAYPLYARHFSFRIRWRHISFSLGFGVPIVVHLLSGVMHNSIDRAILAGMVPVSHLGIYTLGYQVGTIMNVITSAVNNAWQPSYYELMESDGGNKDRLIQKTYNLWLFAMSIICMVGILWGGDILRLITPENFHGAGVVLPYVMLGYFFHGMYYFASSPIFFYKKTVLLPWLTGAAAGLNIVLNLMLIPRLGIVGAALATTLSMLAHAAAAYVLGKRLHDHGFSLRLTVLLSSIMVASFIGFLFLQNGAVSHFFRIGCLAAMVLAAIWPLRKELKNTISQMMKPPLFRGLPDKSL